MDLLRLYYTQNPAPMEDGGLFDTFKIRLKESIKWRKEEAAVNDRNRFQN